MKAIILFFKTQVIFLITLIIFTIIPFYFLCVHLPQIPLTEYFFLIVLFFMKLIIFDQNYLKKKLTPIVRNQLQKELGKVPSQNQIFKRVMFHIKSRDFSMLLVGISLIIMGIVFQRF